MGQLWDLVEAYRDGERWPPSYRAMALKVGVSPTAFTNWRALGRRLPESEHLHAFAELIGVPYSRVLDAALADAGYYGKAHDDGAATTAAGGAPAFHLRRTRSTARMPGAAPADDPAEPSQPPAQGHGGSAQDG